MKFDADHSLFIIGGNMLNHQEKMKKTENEK